MNHPAFEGGPTIRITGANANGLQGETNLGTITFACADAEGSSDGERAARLIAELEYPDPNGELLTAVGRVRLVPSAVQLGIRREGWDVEIAFRVEARRIA